MPDVCRYGPVLGICAFPARPQNPFKDSSTIPRHTRVHRHAPVAAPAQYQKTLENAYGLRPRPPQTSAARFKRLYRK
jgi:hypothetical protein